VVLRAGEIREVTNGDGKVKLAGLHFLCTRFGHLFFSHEILYDLPNELVSGTTQSSERI